MSDIYNILCSWMLAEPGREFAIRNVGDPYVVVILYFTDMDRLDATITIAHQLDWENSKPYMLAAQLEALIAKFTQKQQLRRLENE